MIKSVTRALVGLVLFAGTACFAQDPRPGAAYDSACALPPGWDKVAERNPSYVVFGELHGTQESPQFVGALVCALASKGERVLLAVEHSAIVNAAFQAAWNGPADRFEAALADTGWAGRRDGVASEAMFAMLVKAHELKERGLSISIVAFNGARDAEQARRFADLPGQGPHEAAQADNIAVAASSGDYDRVLVLVGSLHARTDEVERGGVRFEPMARRLARSGTTVSLEMRYGAGTAWNCFLKQGVTVVPGQPLSPDALDCANHSGGGNAALEAAPFIGFSPPPGLVTEGEYDGFFWVGPISGSAPLRPAG